MCIYLTYVASWLVFNKLTLNTNKTVYMTFGSYCDSVPNALHIKLDIQSIKNEIPDFYFCENEKYYGNKNANDNVLCIPQHIKLWHNSSGRCI